jgi:hypothetical protein
MTSGPGWRTILRIPLDAILVTPLRNVPRSAHRVLGSLSTSPA